MSNYLSFFFERIRQIAVCIGKIRLQLDGPTISINCQIDKSLLIVDACQVSMYDRIIR